MSAAEETTAGADELEPSVAELGAAIDASRVAALLEERRGYLVRGLANRVAQLDAELAKFGLEVGVPVEAAVAEKPARRGR